ncbi:substrate-binding domain-containing protein [Pontibacter qinzhouensis]|uniref:histidine kinase n=1 Tax=Pontibacter qinzhouensis TaxID=2603253 RepID=A0A5C8K9A5_9BACT|nr:substrate-binding domain-containing protein [Pontibacter qinzhouensis]TXK46100.1 substrate-binding domain-containing protein [Pontibacter qinzhouensis]
MAHSFKLLTFVLLLFLVALPGCGPAGEEKAFVIGFSQCTEGDAWRKAMHEEMEREASFYPELSLQIKDGKNSSVTQIKHIREFIDQGVDLLIVSPNEAEPITPVVEEAFSKGIPVIVVDRKTSSSMYTAYVGANNYQIGKLAGEYVAKLLNGKGRIIEVWGLRGSSPAIERHNSFVDAIAAYPDIEIVAEVSGEWEKEVAKERFPAVFNQQKDVDLIFAHNDVMALGAYESLQNRSVQQQLKFIGFDGLGGPNGGLQFVQDGILDATFLYPTGGEEIIQLAHDILHNKPFKKDNILNTTVIDDRNVHIMKQQSDKILAQEKNIERQQQKLYEQIQLFNNQRTLSYVLLASLVVSIIMGAVALLSLSAKKEANKELLAKNNEVMQQRNEVALMARKADKATEAKLRFFTNVSHEFRTPLTLILGPVEDALHSPVSADLKKDMQLVKQNAIRLLRLVNQLMDFSKVDNRKMKLQAAEADLVAFVKDITNSFDRLARKRNISFRFRTKLHELPVFFDADKLDKILFNLLSNAFKFTSDGGTIAVGLQVEDRYEKVIITVEDNGKGMSPAHAAHAFDRFHTGEDSSNLGTGLGLALSEEFVKLHHGDISVVSEEWKGTKFIISLPLGKEHLTEDELLTDAGKNAIELIPGVMDAEQQVVSSESAEVVEDARLKEHTILLIEDNKELREFLKSRLAKDFNVAEAPNGTVGLQQAFEKVPDLVICDVMLPKQNGLEITAALKNDLRTSHIPVILLTAKDTVEYKIEGIQSGADLYVTKPFSYLYLFERVKGLLKNRALLKEHYSSEISVETKVASPPKQLDKKFMNEVMAVVEKNLSNPDLNANSIAASLGMSKVQVYRKMKALLGYSVNDYVNNMRLKRARHLLLHSDKNISEIAYEVGFSSPAYFSTAFKNHFEMSPSDFKTTRSSREGSNVTM